MHLSGFVKENRDSGSCTLPEKCTSFILLDNLVVTHGLKN